ncbi:hypothetical protein [Peptoniphilus sp.]|uniref:hypothetical protein n=1 Tax=Peptoniphilus sp. TaxID=1971214 RepID=UPI0039932AC4
MAYHKWTEEEVEFIRKVYPHYPNKIIIVMIKEKFGFDITDNNLSNVKNTNGIPHKVISNSGCFKKGFIPWNKGIKMSEDEKEKSKATWFKKGNKPHNTLQVGSTRITKDGYKEIKVAEPNKWMLYQRYLYEKIHDEKLSKDDTIIFADGDKSNFDIDNLVKVSRSTLLVLNRNNLIYDDKELTKVGVSVGKLLDKANKRKKEVKK